MYQGQQTLRVHRPMNTNGGNNELMPDSQVVKYNELPPGLYNQTNNKRKETQYSISIP